MTKNKGMPIIIVVSCEKEDLLGSLSHLLFKYKTIIRAPEREDRRIIVEHCIRKILPDWNNANREIDTLELAKYLQGKSFRDISNLLQKLLKTLPSKNIHKVLIEGIT